MKTKLIICSAILLAMSLNTQAVILSSSVDNITDWTNGTEVSTAGTLVEAVNWGNANVDTTINGVTFKKSAGGYCHENSETFGNASFTWLGGDSWAWGGILAIPGAYFTLGNSQLYGNSTGVVNLKGGYVYELQIFMFDDRMGQNKTFSLDFYQANLPGNPYDTCINWNITQDSSPM